MAVRCSKCGEELLGPVNRCWKCGQQFSAQPEAGGLPPVRYAPVELPADVVMAEVSAEPSAAVPAHASTASDAPPSPRPIQASTGGGAIRTGSPFVGGAVMQPVASPRAPRQVLTPGLSPRIPGPPRHDPVAVAGAIASIVMGLIAVSIAWMTSVITISAAVVIALVGFSLGIWGLYSKRRGWALFGILISCAALGLATYSGSMLIHQSMREQEELNEVDPGLP